MAFFSNTQDLKKYLAVNVNLSLETIEPHIPTALSDYMVEHLGQEIIDDIENNISSSGIYEKIVPKFLQSLASFAFLQSIPFIEVSIGDHGITRTESEHTKTAYQGQIKRLEQSSKVTAYNCLDQLMTLMQKENYNLWPSAPGYVRHNEFLFIDTLDFNNYYPLLFKAITYKSLIPFQRKVQDFDLPAIIGNDQLADFIIHKAGKSDPIYDKGIELLKKGVAHLSIAYALRGNAVQYTFKGVQFYEEFPDTSSTNHASANEKSTKDSYFINTGNDYLMKLVGWMNGHLDDFEQYRDDESIEKIGKDFYKGGNAGNGLIMS